MNNFANKTILVTGASRGIGRTIAHDFATRGAQVYANYFVSEYEPDAQENIDTLLKDIDNETGHVIPVHFDVSSKEQVTDFFHNTNTQFDVVVNNAGVVVDKDLKDRTYEEWQWTINTNLGGTFLVSQHVMGRMNGGGAIVNIASSNAIDCFSPESADYDASKAGIIITTRNFAKELAGRVRVNAVAPGWVNTEMNTQLESEVVEEETEAIYMKRFAEPQEIASVVLFLASEQASYINGETIKVDGGHG